MTQETKIKVKLDILLPAGLLGIEIVVVSGLLIGGYQLPQLVSTFFVFSGIYCLYQIVRQLMTQFQVNQAINRIKDAEKLAAEGHLVEAVRLWKSLLLKLPKEQFLSVLSKMKRTYHSLGMDKAVQQIKTIHSESMEFFKKVGKVDRPTKQDQQEWQDRAFKLRKLIQDLPIEPFHEFSNSNRND
mgnify:CR=1 FL=1